MNKKGFTLVELIAVVVVLGIIALIAIPAVSGYMYKAEDNFYVTTERSVLASGRDYFSDYHSLLPKNDGETTSVPVDRLVREGYIDPIINKDDETCNGIVYVTRKEKNDYSYCVVMYCGENKIEKRNTCEGTPTLSIREYDILHKDVINVEQCSTYNEMLNKIPINERNTYIYKNKLVGKLVRAGETTPLQNNGEDIVIYPDESSLNLKTLGKYQLPYEYNGADTRITKVNVIDNVKPQEISVSIRLGSKNGSPYNCNSETDCNDGWVNNKIVLVFSGKDMTNHNECNANGSGIAYFLYKLEGDPDYRKVTAFYSGNGYYAGYVMIPENSYKGVIKYNAIDKEENYAFTDNFAPSKYLMFDTIAPECVSSDGNDSWTNETRTIKGTCSDDLSGCLNTVITKLYDYEINSTAEGPGEVVDNAGNRTTCPNNQTVKIDKTKPVVSAISITDRFKDLPQVKATCSDELSGVKSEKATISCVKTSSNKATCTATCEDNSNNINTNSKPYEWSDASDPCGTHADNYHDCNNCCCSDSYYTWKAHDLCNYHMSCEGGWCGDCYNIDTCDTGYDNDYFTYSCEKEWHSYCKSYTCACGTEECYDLVANACWH